MKQKPIPRNDDASLRSEAQQGAAQATALLSTQVLDATTARDYLRANAKPPHEWRVGLEFEVIGFDSLSQQRIDQRQVAALLAAFARCGGVPQREGERVVAMRMPYGDITLEPGGQIELSALPHHHLAGVATALHMFLDQLAEFGSELRMEFTALGFDPLRRLDEQFWIAKRRYEIMRPYLRRQGGHAWDMMTRTAALQISVDYGDEEDMARKYVLGNRLGPIVAAMFANSPFADGRVTGLKSTRYASWLDTDEHRTGPGFGTCEETFDLDAYLAAVLDVPLLFLNRKGSLQDVAGKRLRDIDGAAAHDFPDLLSMIFTEARIRQYVEMRSADSGGFESALALSALWKGLLYDPAALRAALQAAPRLDPSAFRALQMAVARDALAAVAEGVAVLDVAREVLALARAGLERIAPDEAQHLDALSQRVIIDGLAPADILLRDSGADARRATRLSRVA
ncbi:MAG: hypothetical protein DLM53_04700 [Candidatus Eremiobacter antarcticus]|nr:hypothetical protein [Candidatus Eremiobacteraeota bacterium]MBC5807917.1 hypothetical protein [Candidatus Eremiobacteraeota bacterium]PZR62714.1 MAG: hypothetical protein DLM53_04700 [Candidatus Eremiobacter sp. RRmetagenome_bin22]